MTPEQQFWSIIEKAWPTTQQANTLRQLAFTGELDDARELYTIQNAFLDNITTALDRLEKDDLLQFDRILEQKLYDIDREDIQEYTGGSSDGFLYCRGFIVSMGEAYYTLIQTDPSRAVMDVEFEEFCYHPRRLYEQKYGQMPLSDISRETGSNYTAWE